MTEMIRAIRKEFPDATRDSLIPILQRVQDAEGYLPRTSLIEVSAYLDLPMSKIYGVASFYNQFRFEAIGKNHILVCRGTACHVKGSLNVLNVIKRELGIQEGQTTRDGLFTLDVVACIGACGLAPVISINGEFHAKLTPETVTTIIDEFRRAVS